MEINGFDQVIGVVAQEDIVEGRFVVLTGNALGGSLMNVDADLPGAKLPDTAEEAKRAKFCLTFAVDNRTAPIVDWPQTTFDFRGGFVNAQAGPLTGLKMWLTHPGNQESQTVPSGYKALAFTEGTFTIPSGQYVYDANLETPGAAVMIADAATDGAGEAGKPKFSATIEVGTIGFVQVYDDATGDLTIRVE
jgi:hypothetical protein